MSLADLKFPDFTGHPPPPQLTYEQYRRWVCEDIIPELSVAVADALIEKGYEMDPAGLDLAYQLTLRVFFRMLFQVYAEDRKLLPYGENNKYDRNAIKTIAIKGKKSLKLQRLLLSNNQIDSVELSHIPTLEYIYISKKLKS